MPIIVIVVFFIIPIPNRNVCGLEISIKSPFGHMLDRLIL